MQESGAVPNYSNFTILHNVPQNILSIKVSVVVYDTLHNTTNYA